MAVFPTQFSIPYLALPGFGLLLPIVISPTATAVEQFWKWLEVLFEATGVRPEKYRSIDQLWRIYYVDGRSQG